MATLALALAAPSHISLRVFVTSASHPGCVLLSQRDGTWSLPGRRVSVGSTVWALAAEEVVLAETGLRVRAMRCASVLRPSEIGASSRDVRVLMSCEAKGEPQNRQDAWRWSTWADPLPEPLEETVKLAQGAVDPFSKAERAADDEQARLPRCIRPARDRPDRPGPSCRAVASVLLRDPARAGRRAAPRGEASRRGGRGRRADVLRRQARGRGGPRGLRG